MVISVMAPPRFFVAFVEDKGRAGGGGRTTPVQAVQACCPSHTHALLYRVSLRGVQSGHGACEVPHCRLTIQCLHELHIPVLTDWTPGAWLTHGHFGCRQVRALFLDTGLGGMPQQRAAVGEFRLPHAVGQEAEVPHSVEPMWRHVEHQPPQELDGLQCQGAQAVAVRIVLIAEGHLAVLQGHEPVVRDGDAMRITGQVLQDVLRVLDGAPGVSAVMPSMT